MQSLLRARRALIWVFALFAFFLAVPARADEKVVLAFGDSLTAGFGLKRQDSFPSRLEMALRGAGHKVRVKNGGVSGDTTAGGLARLSWLMHDDPDLVIVELGANDALRGFDPAGTRRNLDTIVRRIRASGTKVLLAGMRAPPNMGDDYAEKFNAIFPDLARKHNVPLYGFFLDGVILKPDLMQPDGIHPNAAGVAEIVERILPSVTQALKEEQP